MNRKERDEKITAYVTQMMSVLDSTAGDNITEKMNLLCSFVSSFYMTELKKAKNCCPDKTCMADLQLSAFFQHVMTMSFNEVHMEHFGINLFKVVPKQNGGPVV